MRLFDGFDRVVKPVEHGPNGMLFSLRLITPKDLFQGFIYYFNRIPIILTENHNDERIVT